MSAVPTYEHVKRRARALLAHWRRRIRRDLGAECYSRRTEYLSVILLSYKRPRNLNLLLSAVVLCEFVQEILISNNNPEICIEDYIRVQDRRIRIINQPTRRFASIRMELALEATSPYLLAIDDDVFLEPEQIRTLFECLVDDPAVVHGYIGEVFSEHPPLAKEILRNCECRVEALMWLFAFTREHARVFFQVLNDLGIENRQLSSSEDVPLSFSGLGFAKIHRLGRVLSCPTENQPGIATWKNPGFMEQRMDLLLKVRHLRGFDRRQLARGETAW